MRPKENLRVCKVIIALLLGAATSPLLADDGVAFQRGRIAFLRCASCHSIMPGEPHKVGPNLSGAIGGAAARDQGFTYTDALRQAALTWDDATLKRWIVDPSALVPGTSMVYANSLGDADITALLAFLKSETAARPAVSR